MLRRMNTGMLGKILQDVFFEKPLPTLIYVYRSDGASQYYTVDPPINISIGDKIGFDFIGGITPGAYKRFLYFNEYNFSIDTGASGDVFRMISASAKLDDDNVSSGNTKIPLSGIHTLVVTSNVNGTLATILSAYQEHFMNLPIFNFYVERNGQIIHEIPMNNLEQGADQIATVGTSNVTAVNYLADNWELLSSNDLVTWYNKETGLVYSSESIENNDEVIR